ncbi:hypothetical protein GKR73_08010 [Providencia stuartii]|nr:hypothetical protein [Providencia stuartii]
MDVVSFDLCSNSILGSPLAIHSLLSQLDHQLSGLASGGVIKNRAGWAHDRLKRAGLSQSLSRGKWCLFNGNRYR